MLKLLRWQGTYLQADSLVLVRVRGAVTAFLAAFGVAAFPAADLSTAERTAFTSFTLPVQLARRAAHFCTTTQCQHRDTDLIDSKTVCQWDLFYKITLDLTFKITLMVIATGILRETKTHRGRPGCCRSCSGGWGRCRVVSCRHESGTAVLHHSWPNTQTTETRGAMGPLSLEAKTNWDVKTQLHRK